jgi:hypothetical protein
MSLPLVSEVSNATSPNRALVGLRKPAGHPLDKGGPIARGHTAREWLQIEGEKLKVAAMPDDPLPQGRQ